MRTRNKALAASFVMTFAAGCDNTTSQPPTAPTVDVAPNPPAPASASASAQPTPPASASASATPPTPPLPPAPTVGRTEKQPDGTCMWFPAPCPVVNGRILACNPPRPHLVQCPPGDGGT